jgi:signal transduction histidine kinase
MDRASAIGRLSSQSTTERLEAARYLAAAARASDRELLRHALERESVTWIRTALKKAVARAEQQTPESAVPDVDIELAAEETYAQAIEETTGRIVHELRPIVGAVRFYVAKEFSGFVGSETERQLDRLESMMEAVDQLSKASSAPFVTEFNLPDLVQQVVDQETIARLATIEIGGPSPLLVRGDPALIGMCIRNGLCNALEATSEVGEAHTPVVVSWGETDIDYWLVVLDRGPGLPPARGQLFDIGSTTKLDHLGMGLALALRAATTMGGRLTLGDRDGGGVRYELRWPHPEGS